MAKRKKRKFSHLYWIHVVFIFFAVNFVVTQNLKFRYLAANCMYRDDIQNDSRCLYTYQGSVYEKGSQSRPHKGVPCGTDVTTIIPSFHTAKMAKYMDPNLVGAVCVGNAVPKVTSTSTPTPTRTPTSTPKMTSSPTATPRPTESISTPSPSRAPDRTGTPVPTMTAQAAPSPTSSPTPSPASTETPTPTPTNAVQIVMNQSGTGFGKFIADSGRNTAPLRQNPVEIKQTVNRWQKITIISEILLMASMVALIISVVVHVARRIQYL